MIKGIDLSDKVRKYFFQLFESENVNIAFTVSNTKKVLYCEKAHRLTDENYILRVSKTPEINISVECSGEKSAFYALCDISKRIKENKLEEGEFINSPSFCVRGYIEGFYGEPWTKEKRKSVLETAALNRMNTVYFAPKDDAYHRELWRELYPENELMQIKELLNEANQLYMNFYWCIAPGLSMKYSDDAEFDCLIKKTRQLYNSGVRYFGLLLDDISEELTYEEDKKSFGETVNAHIDLVNRYYEALKSMDSKIHLTVCPTLYNGRGDEYYISKFGQGIPPFVSVFWTGRDVCSRDLTSFEAIKFIENTGHKPLYWDNYPVNDGSMYNEMHLSPIINRSPDLWKYSEGIISNCMEYAECSKIPLITFADYLWDSENYEPEASFENAIRQVIGEEDAETFLVFADHLYTSCLKDVPSRRMMAMFDKVDKAFENGNTQDAMLCAGEYIMKMNNCRKLLEQDRPIFKELKKWSDKFSVACEILNKLMSMIINGDQSILEEIFDLIKKYDAMPAKLTEDMDIKSELMGLINQLS